MLSSQSSTHRALLLERNVRLGAGLLDRRELAADCQLVVQLKHVGDHQFRLLTREKVVQLLLRGLRREARDVNAVSGRHC